MITGRAHSKHLTLPGDIDINVFKYCHRVLNMCIRTQLTLRGTIIYLLEHEDKSLWESGNLDETKRSLT